MVRNVRRFAQALVFIGLVAFHLQAPEARVLAEPFAVRYTLEGFLVDQKGHYTLNTEDGRVFELVIDAEDAKNLADQRVRIEGKAHRGDELSTIKVKKIMACPAPEKPVPPVEHADYQRPVTVIEATADRFVVNNIRWDISQDPATATMKAIHSWETATIVPDLVENVYFTVKPFFPEFLAAHSMLVFTFRPGGFTTISGKENQALALSIEAYKKLGQSYGLIKCMKKTFEIVWDLVTWSNYATLNVKFNKDKDKHLILYPVRLTQDQKVRLLRETVIQAGMNRQGEFYHTTRNNCTNNLIMLLNRVLPPSRQIKLWTIPSVLYNFKATMPISVVKMLQKKGLLDEPLPEITPETFTTRIGSGK